MKKYFFWYFYIRWFFNGMYGFFGIEEEGAKVIEFEGYVFYDVLGGVFC